MEAFMEFSRRHLLMGGAAGAGAVGLAATGFLTVSPAGAATVPGVTDVLYLTGTDADNTVDWDFQVAAGRRSGEWSRIATPSNWECRGFGNYNYGGRLVPEEIGRYRTTFTAPASWAGRQVFVVFEGSMTDTEVWVNGTSAGAKHQGGFYRFRYDVTALLKLGESNLLEVTVAKESSDNSINNAERRGDYWNFGGIYRPVSIQAFPAARIDRVAINAQASGAFAADVYLAGVTRAASVVGQIKRLDGTNVGGEFPVGVAAGATKATLTTTVSAPQLWTAETPNLYQLHVRLTDCAGDLLHTISERFGFRTIEVRANGVFVNGSRVMLKGSNRHTFWPTLGRASSPRLARLDIMLMKEMNMNAVRMSHYPPDTFFLDLCDELGLYVLDELAGWQRSYDEGVGAPLVASMVQRDVNHPSILFWDNGNEGGWNTALDDDFALYDPQKRKVLHPMDPFNGIDTNHYAAYDLVRTRLGGSNVYMPTEFMHGLYDGGAGAGLNDYWNLMVASPKSAGGFIWAFVDEALVRDDRGGALDTEGNRAPDGILGPFREKEGSYATIRDIWSPVQLRNPSYYATTFPNAFDQTVKVVNRYDFTNLDRCRFTWQLLTFPAPGAASTDPTVVAEGTGTNPAIPPGGTGAVTLQLPSTWRDADALRLSVADPDGRVVNTWVWTIKKAVDHVRRLVVPGPGCVRATETADSVTMSAGATRVTISKSTGRLAAVNRDGTAVSLTNGPAVATGSATLTGLTHNSDGTAHVVQATYSGDLSTVRWRLDANGWLRLDYYYRSTGPRSFLGVNLDYPESKVRGLTWLGHGPYRVYKNRMRGPVPGVWAKDYNNTVTGSAGWQYPEFKGYHANTYWAALRTTEGTITMVAAEENLFLRLFTPVGGPDPLNLNIEYPAGNISFLDGIAPIGNKFANSDKVGPESQPNIGAGDYRRTVYFRFSA
jgi:hypothetical protein